MDRNLKARVATAALALPALFWLVGWSPSWIFSLAVLIITLGALREFFEMVFPHDRRHQSLGIIFGVALSASVFLDAGPGWAALVFVGFFAAYLFAGDESTERLRRLSLSVLGMIYGGFLLPQIVVIFRHPQGRAWTLWLLAVVMSGDTLAYFIGRRFGKRKLAPHISPGKTVEGAWAYMAGAVISGSASAVLLFSQWNWAEVVLLSLAVGILGQLGDLFESLVKRAFAVKDASTLLPGHGGLLDRLDSLIFPAVFTSTYLKVFHP